MDTGAQVSVIPPAHHDNKQPTGQFLYTANQGVIQVFGEKALTLNLGLRRPINWIFTIADLPYPIIGADLMYKYNIAVDLSHSKIIDTSTGAESTGTFAPAPVNTITSLSGKSRYSSILQEFPGLLGIPSNNVSRKHSVKHYIPTTGSPCSCRVRPLRPERLKQAKAEFQLMINLGNVRPCSSPWSSALHMAAKKDGDWRPCGDYRQLNSQTIPDRYPIALIQDYSSILAGKKIFSKIDLKKAFHHIPVAEEDVPKTAVLTPFGLFEFLCMPFGLRNAAQTFQRFINEVLSGLEFVYAYIDDLLIASTTQEEHEEHLRSVFKRLSEYGLCISPDKCVFGSDQIDFLGYRITPDGVAPLPDRVNALINFKKPETIAELRRFIGAINFYRRHIKNAAATQAPLNDILKDSKKNDKRPVPWTSITSSAFDQMRHQLAQATLLAHPVHSADLRLTTDASSSAVGAVLEQSVNDSWQPLGFFSRKLSPAQQKYSTYDRELTAIYEAIKYFRPWLEARDFAIRTDHKPLVHAFRRKNDKSTTPVQLRQLSFISQFSTNIQYINGSANSVADALSRIDALRFPTTIDFNQLAQAQATDQELQKLLADDESSLKLQKLTYGKGNQVVYCDVSTNDIRPYVPEQFRRQVYDTFHNLSHPSGRSTNVIISQRYVWPSMNKDITYWARNCVPCQKSKIGRHVHTQPGTFTNPDQRFDHVHIDLVGPLPEVDGLKYCLTMVDRFTRWPEAIPVRDITADTVANAFFSHWIARFGCPKIVTTDQGSQFESALYTSLLNLVGGKRIRTTAYHPPANGLVERWHRTMKAAIMCHQNPHWTKVLPTVLLGLRTCYKEELKASPAEFLYGSTLRIPGEFFTHEDPPGDPNFFLEDFRVHMRNVKPVPAAHHCKQKTFCYKDLYTCSHVFLRVDGVKRPLEQPYSGPHEVVKRLKDDRTFVINLNGKETVVNVERLKPAHLATDDVFNDPVQPPDQPSALQQTNQSQQLDFDRIPGASQRTSTARQPETASQPTIPQQRDLPHSSSLQPYQTTFSSSLRTYPAKKKKKVNIDLSKNQIHEISATSPSLGGGWCGEPLVEKKKRHTKVS